MALTEITKTNLNISDSKYIDWFIFFGTVFGYNILKNLNFYKLNFKQFNKYQVLVLLVSLSMMVFLYYFIENRLRNAILEISFLIIIYPFLRQFGLIKIFIVAFSFTFITVYIPLIAQNINPLNHKIYALQRFIILVCFIIPFEILDSKNDHQSLKTIPQHFGIYKTKLFGLILLVLYTSLQSPEICDIGIVILSGFFIIFSNQNRKPFYTLFWVESLPLIWLGLYTFKTIFFN